MNVADQVLSYLKVLVWPVIVACALVLFRDPIGGLLGSIEEFEGFGVKAKIRRQVTQAAQDSRQALARNPVSKVSDPAVGGRIFIIARNMERALRFSVNISYPRETDLSPNQLQRMRRVVERLDTAVIAVLVGTGITDSDQATETGVPPLTTPASVEAYMVNLTGYAGWRGVTETRDILRGTLALVCGKAGRAISFEEVTLFISVGEEAIVRLNGLVNVVVNSARRFG